MMITVVNFVGINGINMISRLAGMCVMSIVYIAPNLFTRRLEITPPTAPTILQIIRIVPMSDSDISHRLENQ
jgi:hypothetical protein